MSNYNPMLESQKFSAEVLQRGQSEAQQTDQRATEHLADTVRSVTQSNANRKESARQFDQSSQQRQQEFQQERGDRQQAREQAQGNWEKEYAQRQSQLAEAVRQHAESFSLEKKRFDLAVSEAALHEEVQKKIIEQKGLELQAFDIEHQRAMRQIEAETARSVLRMNHLNEQEARQRLALEQTKNMTNQERMDWSESVGASQFSNPSEGEMGPVTAGSAKARAMAATRGYQRGKVAEHLMGMSKSLSQMDPDMAKEIGILGVMVESGTIQPDEAINRMQATTARKEVVDIGATPLTKEQIAQRLAKLGDTAREVHGMLDANVPLGNEARLKLAGWVEQHEEEIVLGMQAAAAIRSKRPLDTVTKEGRKEIVNRWLQQLRPGSKEFEDRMSLLFSAHGPFAGDGAAFQEVQRILAEQDQTRAEDARRSSAMVNSIDMKR